MPEKKDRRDIDRASDIDHSESGDRWIEPIPATMEQLADAIFRVPLTDEKPVEPQRS